MTRLTPEQDERLAWLTEGQLKGELTLDQKAELAEMLDSSDAAKERFVELVELETALTEAHQEPRSERSVAQLKRAKWTALSVNTLPWWAAAAGLVFVFVYLNQTKPVTDNNVLPSDYTALIVNEVDAAFSPPRPLDAQGLETGDYDLQRGSIHLRFNSGADLVIEGPARFELLHARRTRLAYGNVRAIVPPVARGFTVVTQHANYEDIGTEFGLRVNPTKGLETLMVFDGRVNVRNPSTDDLVQSLTGGEVFQFKDGVPIAQAEVDPASFPVPGDISHQRWLRAKEHRLQDPNLLALFTFEPDDQAPMTLRNIQGRVNPSVSDAKVEGARWVSGRWPGKKALLFDRSTDFAELDIVGEFTEFTVAAWVFVDGLHNTLNAVFNSNGWDAGDVHVQIMRHGGAHADTYAEPDRNERTMEVIPIGEWVHLAATFSSPEKTIRVYLNGEPAYETAMGPDEKIQPGTCRIGNWLPAGNFASQRSLHGRMDELAMWNRVLSEATIQAETRSGRPRF
ncbi:MAG: hypothetical protein ACI9TH_003236 [Kiritimatiellia bacterium]|jgi:hypothetical protein